MHLDVTETRLFALTEGAEMLRNVLWVLVSLNVLFQTSPSQYHPDYIWDRTGGQGKLWLSWSPERRQGFSRGYLWAYHVGFRQACVAYFEANPPEGFHTLLEDSPDHKCMLRELHYSKGPDDYAAQVTTFYEKYPADVDLPIAWLFQAFSDSENKGPEEIHRAWSKHAHP
jgi:hypothetical protein